MGKSACGLLVLHGFGAVIGLVTLVRAFRVGSLDIFNTDQGSQLHPAGFSSRKLKERQIQISMDGRGLVFDNIFTERLWRSLKYEDIYLIDYRAVPEAEAGIAQYFSLYNERDCTNL